MLLLLVAVIPLIAARSSGVSDVCDVYGPQWGCKEFKHPSFKNAENRNKAGDCKPVPGYENGGIMFWADIAKPSDAYSVRTGNGPNPADDPHTYKPGQLINIWVKVLKRDMKFRGLLINAVTKKDSKVNQTGYWPRVGVWEFPEDEVDPYFWTNENCPKSALQNSVLEKPYTNLLRFRAPTETNLGPLTIQTLLKTGPANRGEFWFPKDLVLLPHTGGEEEGAVHWSKAEMGQSCSKHCESKKLHCREQEMVQAGSGPELMTAVGEDVMCALPMFSGCASDVSPVVTDGGTCFYHDEQCGKSSSAECSASHPKESRICACSTTQVSLTSQNSSPKASAGIMITLVALLIGFRWRGSSLLFLSLLLMTCFIMPCNAHNWYRSEARSLKFAQGTRPCPQRVGKNNWHVQVGPGQSFSIAWAVAHGYPSYLTLVKAEDIDNMRVKSTYMKAMDEYFAEATDENLAHTDEWMRTHGSHVAPEGGYPGAKPGPGFEYDGEDKTKSYAAEIDPSDPIWHMSKSCFDEHGGQKDPTTGVLNPLRNRLWKLQPDRLKNDVRHRYKSEKHPWIIEAARLEMSEVSASEFDQIKFVMPEDAEPGHYIVHWDWRGYNDCVDIDYRSNPVPESRKNGLSPVGGGMKYNKIDHCQYVDYNRQVTTCHTVAPTVEQCILDMSKWLHELVATTFRVGVNAVPMLNPAMSIEEIKSNPNYGKFMMCYEYCGLRHPSGCWCDKECHDKGDCCYAQNEVCPDQTLDIHIQDDPPWKTLKFYGENSSGENAPWRSPMCVMGDCLRIEGTTEATSADEWDWKTEWLKRVDVMPDYGCSLELLFEGQSHGSYSKQSMMDAIQRCTPHLDGRRTCGGIMERSDRPGEWFGCFMGKEKNMSKLVTTIAQYPQHSTKSLNGTKETMSLNFKRKAAPEGHTLRYALAKAETINTVRLITSCDERIMAPSDVTVRVKKNSWRSLTGQWAQQLTYDKKLRINVNPENAIDGNFDNHAQMGSCARTKDTKYDWWKVTLPDVEIAKIRVMTGLPDGDMFRGYEVYIDDNLCGTFKTDPGTMAEVELNCGQLEDNGPTLLATTCEESAAIYNKHKCDKQCTTSKCVDAAGSMEKLCTKSSIKPISDNMIKTYRECLATKESSKPVVSNTCEEAAVNFESNKCDSQCKGATCTTITADLKKLCKKGSVMPIVDSYIGHYESCLAGNVKAKGGSVARGKFLKIVKSGVSKKRLTICEVQILTALDANLEKVTEKKHSGFAECAENADKQRQRVMEVPIGGVEGDSVEVEFGATKEDWRLGVETDVAGWKKPKFTFYKKKEKETTIAHHKQGSVLQIPDEENAFEHLVSVSFHSPRHDVVLPTEGKWVSDTGAVFSAKNGQRYGWKCEHPWRMYFAKSNHSGYVDYQTKYDTTEPQYAQAEASLDNPINTNEKTAVAFLNYPCGLAVHDKNGGPSFTRPKRKTWGGGPVVWEGEEPAPTRQIVAVEGKDVQMSRNKWEMELPNGWYKVIATIPEMLRYNKDACSIEGQNMRFSGAPDWQSLNYVEVKDGRLTIMGDGSSQLRLNQCHALVDVRVFKVKQGTTIPYVPAWFPAHDDPWKQQDLGTSKKVGIVTLKVPGGSCSAGWFYQQYSHCHMPGPFGYFDGENEGALVGISDTPCKDFKCGGTVCGKIKKAPLGNGQAKTDYFQYQGWDIEPEGTKHTHYVDCDGKSGRYIWVQLPGKGRILAEEVQINANLLHPAEDPERFKDKFMCYGVEAKKASAATPEFQVTNDPEDPLFYSTCFVRERDVQFLPPEGAQEDEAPSDLPYSFNSIGKCLKCDNYKKNLVEPQGQDTMTPKSWEFTEQCVPCDEEEFFDLASGKAMTKNALNRLLASSTNAESFIEQSTLGAVISTSVLSVLVLGLLFWQRTYLSEKLAVCSACKVWGVIALHIILFALTVTINVMTTWSVGGSGFQGGSINPWMICAGEEEAICEPLLSFSTDDIFVSWVQFVRAMAILPSILSALGVALTGAVAFNLGSASALGMVVVGVDVLSFVFIGFAIGAWYGLWADELRGGETEMGVGTTGVILICTFFYCIVNCIVSFAVLITNGPQKSANKSAMQLKSTTSKTTSFDSNAGTSAKPGTVRISA